MTTTNDLFNLPTGPAELCFDKNDFMKKTFSADEFLQENRNAATLETMRDDLGIYLKVLRSAMIELINEDYADFVNLSSNLIGLDQSINGIRQPLEQLKLEITAVKQILNDTMDALSECSQEKEQLRMHLNSIENIAKVYRSMEKLQMLLKKVVVVVVPVSGDSSSATPANATAVVVKQIDPNTNNKLILLERAALEFIQLEFYLNSCKHLLKSNEMNHINDLHKILLKQIEIQFLFVIKSTSTSSSAVAVGSSAATTTATIGGNNLMDLEQCLRIYCTLNECQIAEELFRRHCVAPQMDKIISENALQNSPHGLSGIYKQIIGFINEQMMNLLQLTSSSSTSSSDDLNDCKLKGFNFLINSFWCEIENRLEMHMSSIFAPGNPDLFYQKYNVTIEFLQHLETYINNPNAIRTFHNHKQYKSFQTRWNLPVYFQIRFQEIGGAFEAVLFKEPFNYVKSSASSSSATISVPTKLYSPIQMALNCITKCWSDGIYLSQLFVKYFKLSLNIFSRLSMWCADECLNHLINLNASTAHLSATASTSQTTQHKQLTENQQFIDQLIVLHSNVKYVEEKIPDYYRLIQTKLPNTMNVETKQKQFELIERCLNDSKELFIKNQWAIREQLQLKVIDHSLVWIKQVMDIPRLYRKTNRDLPSKPCGYIEQMLQLVKYLQQNYATQFQDTIKFNEIQIRILSQLNIHYFNAVDEVLTSVQKTEESLRRLKNLREKSTTSDHQRGGVGGGSNNTIQSTSSSGGGGLTDDDKIRLQLQVDIIYWCQEIEKLNVKRDSISKLNELMKLIEDATKIKIN